MNEPYDSFPSLEEVLASLGVRGPAPLCVVFGSAAALARVARALHRLSPFAAVVYREGDDPFDARTLHAHQRKLEKAAWILHERPGTEELTHRRVGELYQGPADLECVLAIREEGRSAVVRIVRWRGGVHGEQRVRW